jgi:hypothetical protein
MGCIWAPSAPWWLPPRESHFCILEGKKKMEIGDFVKGKPDNGYGITNEHMTRGIVTAVSGEQITVKVLGHDAGKSGKFNVDASKFEVIGHAKPFNRGEVLELLKAGCKKAILEYDLSGANLSDADLSGADLSGANLRRANLSGANLRRADLSGADLSGANLRRADLSGANLRRADLSGANLIGANLRRADLSGADLSGANLRRADLSGANLSDADLSGANLSDADLSGANLSGANLRRANLDFSCYPLWCGSLRLKSDKRFACQLAYHLCSMQCDDAEYIAMRNSILAFANQFHRVDECGKLGVIEPPKEVDNETQQNP